MINHNTWYKTNECGQVIPNTPRERERDFLCSKLVGIIEQPEPFQEINLEHIELLYNASNVLYSQWLPIANALLADYIQGRVMRSSTIDSRVNILHGYVDENGNLFVHYLLDKVERNGCQKWVISNSTPYKVQIGKDGWRLKDNEQ